MFFTRYNRPEGSMLSGQNPPRGPVSITVCLSESHRFMFEQRWISLSFLFLLVSRRMVQTKPTGFCERDKSSSRGQTTQRPAAREALIIEWNIDLSGSSCRCQRHRQVDDSMPLARPLRVCPVRRKQPVWMASSLAFCLETLLPTQCRRV